MSRGEGFRPRSHRRYDGRFSAPSMWWDRRWNWVLADTPAGDERAAIEAGAPHLIVAIAGNQYYEYWKDDGLDGKVTPRGGDRLVLTRDPESAYDPNAVCVFWRNGVQLGHLPRTVAAYVAPHMDAGVPLRAYVWSPGDGRPWSMTALLVGAPLREVMDEEIAAVGREVADYRAEVADMEKREKRNERRRELRHLRAMAALSNRASG